MKVVCIQTQTMGRPRCGGEIGEYPKDGVYKGEIYSVTKIENEFFYLAERSPLNRYRQQYCRPTDSTFGEVVAEIIEKQLELETVEAWVIDKSYSWGQSHNL